MEREKFLTQYEKDRIIGHLQRISEISLKFQDAIKANLTFDHPVKEVAFHGQWMMLMQQDFLKIDTILTRKEGGEQ